MNISSNRIEILLAERKMSMIIINVQNLFLTDSSRVLGLPATAFTFLAFALGAISFFLCCREQNVAAVSRTAAWLTLAGGLVWALLPAGTTAFFSALVMMAGIGGCVSCGSFSFVFVLNNTERFFGSALMLLSISLVKLVSGLAAASAPLRKIFALALAAILIFCTASSRQEDYAGRSSKPDAVFNPSIWLTLFVFFSYFAIRITGFYVSAFAHPADSILRGVLTLVPVLLCVGAQLVFRCSAWTLCNVFFLSAILSYVMKNFRIKRRIPALLTLLLLVTLLPVPAKAADPLTLQSAAVTNGGGVGMSIGRGCFLSALLSGYPTRSLLQIAFCEILKILKQH